MTALPHRPSISVEEYLQLDRSSIETRYEYIDGYIRMLAGGTADHAIISANVISTLHGLLRGSSCRVFTSDLRVRLSQTRYVYPDASVSCDGRDRGQADIVQFPRLIVEVLSPSTEAYDRGRKFSYYRECQTVHEYLLIDSQCRAVELYRREKNPLRTLHAFGSEDEVELVSLGVSFSVAALYENVTFPEDGNRPA